MVGVVGEGHRAKWEQYMSQCSPLLICPAVVTGIQIHSWGSTFDDEAPNLVSTRPGLCGGARHSLLCVGKSGDSRLAALPCLPA